MKDNNSNQWDIQTISQLHLYMYRMIKAFPIFFSIFFLLASFTTACKKGIKPPEVQTLDTTSIRPTKPSDSIKTFLALGDSYTIGKGVDSSLRFPAQTASLLKQKGIIIPHIDYLATSGWTTINLQNALVRVDAKAHYDMVTLLIGVNDQFEKGDTVGYRERYGQLLSKSIQLAMGKRNHVFVLSIPDYSVTPFGGNSLITQKQIETFNSIIKEIAQQNFVSFIDITDISREAGKDLSLLINDLLHPSGKQYALWSKALAPVISHALR